MDLEQRLTEEQKAHILNEVERVRRKVLVSRLYEDGMNSECEEVRQRTAEGLELLSPISPYKYVELYEKGINDKKKRVRVRTARTLGALAVLNPDKYVELYEIGINNDDEEVRLAILGTSGALKKFDPDNSVQLCQEGIKENDAILETDGRIWVLAAVNPDKFNKLYDKVTDDEDILCETAVTLEELAAVNPKRFVELYEEGVNSNDDIVKRETLEILGGLAKINLEKYLELYKKGMDDYDEVITFTTAETLGALAAVNPYKFVELYEQGINNDDEDVRLAIAGTLGALALTLKKDILIPVKDDGYNFFVAYLDSNYIRNQDGSLRDSEDLKAELKELAENPNVDYKKLQKIFEADEAKDLDEIVECAKIDVQDYHIIKKLGSGGSRDAYLAKKGQSSVDTVLKLFRTDFLKTRVDDLRSRHEIAELFIGEVDNLKRLEYPHLIRIFDHGKYGDTFYLEEEYMGGGTFEDYIMSDNFNVYVALGMLRDIMGCVDYLHHHGKVVRDIKLDNILLKRDLSVAKLDDLEFLGELGEKTKYAMRSFGSYRYAAPELMKGGEPTVETDVYALGCCMLYLLDKNRDREFIARINNLPEDEYRDMLTKKLESIGSDFPDTSITDEDLERDAKMNPIRVSPFQVFHALHMVLDYNPYSRMDLDTFIYVIKS